MTNLSWYLHRLSKMPVTELPYRFEQLVKKELDKHAARPFQRDFREHSRCIHRMGTPEFTGVSPELKAQVIACAESTLHHHFCVFGIEKDFGNPVNWHLDPKTDRQWPLIFWGDIDYRDGKTIGGIKFAWELNRLHHLPLLAVAFQMTGERRYREEVFVQLRSWLAGNPYPKGINWISGIEIGVRLINLVYCLKFLADESLTTDEQQTITDFVSLHGRHLCRYPSKYSSCANHAVAEALGLFAAGLCFPGVEEAGRWKKFGKHVLEREVTRQIYPDGSSFEYSVPYLQFVCELFLVYLLLCREYGERCGAQVYERLKASFAFLSAVADGNGNTPGIGDGDDGCVLSLEPTRRNKVIGLLNTGAILFDNPNWILENASYDLATFCLLGEGARARWERLKKQAGRRASAVQCFTDGGLVTIRDRDNLLFVGNGGPLGLEPLGGHGHADCLSFWLSVNDHPMVVDPGTYLYHGGGKWRRYFRSTSAHSTITVDAQDQAPMVSDFMFGRFYHSRWTQYQDSNEYVTWSAEHDAYTRLDDPVVHRRSITYSKISGEFLVEDLLSCHDVHRIESLIHFHPDCTVTLSGQTVTATLGKARLTFHLDGRWASCEIVKGQEAPPLGWYSPSFNEMQASPTLVCRKTVNGTVKFASSICVECDICA